MRIYHSAQVPPLHLHGQAALVSRSDLGELPVELPGVSFLVTQDENGYQVNGYPVPTYKSNSTSKRHKIYVILLSGTPSAKDPIDLRVYSAEVKGYATDVEVFSHVT